MGLSAARMQCTQSCFVSFEVLLSFPKQWLPYIIYLGLQDRVASDIKISSRLIP
jgi:hypothetical protein